jgi:hypothetical protein
MLFSLYPDPCQLDVGKNQGRLRGTQEASAAMSHRVPVRILRFVSRAEKTRRTTDGSPSRSLCSSQEELEQPWTSYAKD